MKTKIAVEVHDTMQARAIATALQRPEIRDLLAAIGAVDAPDHVFKEHARRFAFDPAGRRAALERIKSVGIALSLDAAIAIHAEDRPQ